jgi:hypothetical protein
MPARDRNTLILLDKLCEAGPSTSPAAVAKLPAAADFAGSFTRH